MRVGIDAYLDNNFGDDLMLKLLFDYFPDVNFIIYSNKSIIQNTFSQFSNVEFASMNPINDIDNIDIYLSIGGSIFNDLNTKIGKLKRLNRIRKLKKLKKNKIKIATIGCNLGPYSDKLGLKITKMEARLNDLFTVRDKESYELLTDIKHKTKILLADDIVYCLKQSNIKDDKKDFLGITSYRSLSKEENNNENYLSLAKIIDNYVENTGEKIKLFAYDTENENDLSAAHHIKNNSKYEDHIIIVPYLGNIDSFINELNSCKKLVAIRFHGSILADILKIPFYPIIYSNKTNNLLRDRNYTGNKTYLKELVSNSEEIVKISDSLINNELLFENFKNETNANIHFEELRLLFMMNKLYKGRSIL